MKLHYDRARGALLACENYHLVTWELLTNEEKDATLPLSVLGVSLHVSDLCDRYYAIYHEIDEMS